MYFLTAYKGVLKVFLNAIKNNLKYIKNSRAFAKLKTGLKQFLNTL